MPNIIKNVKIGGGIFLAFILAVIVAFSLYSSDLETEQIVKAYLANNSIVINTKQQISLNQAAVQAGLLSYFEDNSIRVNPLDITDEIAEKSANTYNEAVRSVDTADLLFPTVAEFTTDNSPTPLDELGIPSSMSLTPGIVFYSQNDKRWNSNGIKYGAPGTYAAGGCGPTAMAIVVSSFTGTPITPREMGEYAISIGARPSGGGTNTKLMVKASEKWGLQYEQVWGKENCRNKIIPALQEGKLIIARTIGINRASEGGTSNEFTKNGHFIVLRGLTADGEILVADPNAQSHRQTNNKSYTLDYVVKAINNAGGVTVTSGENSMTIIWK